MIALAYAPIVPLGMGNSVAFPPFTQYAPVRPTPSVESSTEPTAYTSLPESAMPEAEEVA